MLNMSPTFTRSRSVNILAFERPECADITVCLPFPVKELKPLKEGGFTCEADENGNAVIRIGRLDVFAAAVLTV